MSEVIRIIISAVFILMAVLIVIYQVFVPRGNPSKLLADILKIKREGIESDDREEVGKSVLRWRTVAGVFVALVILCILGPVTMWDLSRSYPRVYRVFLPLLMLTIVVLIALWIKERKSRFDKE